MVWRRRSSRPVATAGTRRRRAVVTGAVGTVLLAATVALYVLIGAEPVDTPSARATAGAPSSGAAAPPSAPAGAVASPSVRRPAGPQRTVTAGTGSAPFAFGTLGTLPERAGQEARAGVRVAMLELSWAGYEPAPGAFDAAYGERMRRRLAALRGAGLRVTLGLGLHFTPEWVRALPDSRFVDQRGRVSGEANLVFNQALRARAERYLARVDRDLGLEEFWAVRLTSGGLSEVLYPAGGSYWAFDRNAQNGAGLPPGMAANPAPGWRPGDRSLPTEQVRRWADWYVGALVDVVAWQLRTVAGHGFRGWYQTVTPGGGTRPDGYERDVRAFLPDGVTGVGAVWHRFYADLPVKRNVVAYVSSMADRSGDDDSCAPRDARVLVADRAANTWSAARWIARLAREHGLAVSGENPGWGQPSTLNAHYTDTGSDGMMAASVRQMTSCGFQGMYWAHDDQLWAGPASFDRYAASVAAVNGADSPLPPMP